MLKTSHLLTASDNNADLILIRGLPGSGKSTMAKQLPGRVHLEADAFFERNPSGEYKFDPKLLPTAHRWCLQETEKALSEGKKVVVSNTFTQVWEMQPYLDAAKNLGCTVDVREATGNYKNVHGVPDEALTRMKSRWEKYPTASMVKGAVEAPADIKSKYLAFQVSPASRSALLQQFPPKYPRVICEHITVDFNVNADNFQAQMEKYGKAQLAVVGYATDGQGVEALVVSVDGDSTRPSGGTFHITLSLAEGRKPVESNKIIQAQGFEHVGPIQISAGLVLLKK